jgi:hypothetical protein
MDDVQPWLVAVIFNAIWFGQHSNGATAIWINLSGQVNDGLQGKRDA